MDRNSYFELYELLTKEHQEQYDNFTRLLLSLSVGFITLVIGLKSGNESIYPCLLKLGLVLHAISILSGIWVQHCIVIQPINDLKRAYDLANNSNTHNGFFERPPSKTQSCVFMIQIFSFMAAFVSLVIGILLNY